jgi:hypothetical protein
VNYPKLNCYQKAMGELLVGWPLLALPFAHLGTCVLKRFLEWPWPKAMFENICIVGFVGVASHMGS